jgi:transposase-like protein
MKGAFSMSRKSIYSLEDKLEIVKKVQSGEGSGHSLGKELGISKTAGELWDW